MPGLKSGHHISGGADVESRKHCKLESCCQERLKKLSVISLGRRQPKAGMYVRVCYME